MCLFVVVRLLVEDYYKVSDSVAGEAFVCLPATAEDVAPGPKARDKDEVKDEDEVGNGVGNGDGKCFGYICLG